MVKLDRSGPLGGKWRPSVRKVGHCFVESQHLQGCSPCLCQLMADGLTPASKYSTYWSHIGDMSSVSLVAYRQQRVALPPLLQWLAQERNWVRTHGSVNRRAMDYVRSPFCREQWLCPPLLTTSRKVAKCGPREIRIVEGHTQIEHGKHVVCWSGFPLQGVHRFESPRLSDMSNRLFVAVFT
jgi:hypothetical protein